MSDVELVDGPTCPTLDFQAIKKDTWIEPDLLEKITGTSRDDRMYSLRVEAIRRQIEQQTGLLCRQLHQGIRVMTDSEASEYMWSMGLHSISRLRRLPGRMAKIDRGELSPDDRKELDSRRRILQAAAQAAVGAVEHRARIEGILVPLKIEGGDED